MRIYLVEVYCPNARRSELTDVAARARASAREIAKEGAPVRT